MQSRCRKGVSELESPFETVLRQKAKDGVEVAKLLLEQREQGQTPKRVECNVMGVAKCERCDGDNLAYRAIFVRPNNLSIRVVCEDCGYNRALPHTENLRKRCNTTLEHWREQVLKRDGYKCRLCGSSERLEAHHIIPVSADPDGRYKYDRNNGITLCHECHAMIPTQMK